jgi:hypothetical protein
MPLTYTWNIKNIKTMKDESGEDLVSEIYWVKTGKDSKGVEGSFEGVVYANSIPVLEEEESKFIPYKKLKEENVLNWVKKVVSCYEDHIDRTIQKQIDEQNNVLVDSPLPWVSSAKSEKTSK